MAHMAFSNSEVTNDKSCSKSCLKNYEALKKQYDDLLVKLDDTGFKASTYKRGLSILEGQNLKYKESEVLFSEEISLLKRSVGHKEYQMGLLRTELENVKEEKEGFEFKIAKFEKSAKDLDDLLASQVTDKSKKGFGYNVVPSPHPLILNRPTPLDLSYSGLEEFKQPEVNEYGPRDSSLKPTTGCDKESDNSKENTDDSLKQQQMTDSKKTSYVKSAPKEQFKLNDKGFVNSGFSRNLTGNIAIFRFSKTLMEVMLILVEEHMEAELLVQVFLKGAMMVASLKENGTGCHKFNTAGPDINPGKNNKKSFSSLRDPAGGRRNAGGNFFSIKLNKGLIIMILLKGIEQLVQSVVYKNKKMERGIVIRKQAILVVKTYSERGIDYDEVFTLYRLELMPSTVLVMLIIWIYGLQMDVISCFPIYVDDIIFGSIKKELCDEFEKLMKDKFQMSSIGELTFFLGLQIGKAFGSRMEMLLMFDEHLYRSMIGSLMYLTASWPDIIVCSV
ncbi:hypothetical protein Tco_0636841 [Tanacetum coccineum]